MPFTQPRAPLARVGVGTHFHDGLVFGNFVFTDSDRDDGAQGDSPGGDAAA